MVNPDRDAGVADPRVVFGRHVWHTNSPKAATALLEAGLGWGDGCQLA